MPGHRWFRAIKARSCGPVMRVAFTFALMFLAGPGLMAEEPGVTVRLSSFDREDYRGELRLEVGSTEWASFQYQGTEKKLEVPGLSLPAATQAIVIRGNLAWTHDRFGAQVSKGTSHRPVVDITELMRPFRNDRLSWSERLRQLEAAQESFEGKYEQLGAEVNPRVELGERATASQIAAAERRLGFPLPPDHAKMLIEVGAWSVGDSALTQATDLAPAFQQMIDLWETPAKAMNALPDKTKAFLQRSMILFSETGDGYSALICQPLLEEGKPATYRYYWLTQDEITSPELLKDRDGTPFDHARAMSWLLANQVIRPYENVGTDAAFVDFRAPVPLEYDVDLLFPAPKVLEARMLLNWKHFR